MRLAILGGPGAGKGTQAERLSHALGIQWISTGDMLRQAIVAQTRLGEKVATRVKQGELVADEDMIELIRQRLLQPDVANGWLLDGYPRTAFQAEELDFLLDDLKQRLTVAIVLDVPDAVLVERSLARARADDTPEAIQRRIALFQERTIPLLEYYEMRDRLLRIDGAQAINRVHEDILKPLAAQAEGNSK